MAAAPLTVLDSLSSKAETLLVSRLRGKIERNSSRHFRRAEMEGINRLSDLPAIKRLSDLTELEIPKLFANAGVQLGIVASLYQEIVEGNKKIAAKQQLPQALSHKLVDLWGKREASRALLKDVLRAAEKEEVTTTTAELKSRLHVAVSEIRELMLSACSLLTFVSPLSHWSKVLDWCVAETKSEPYDGLHFAMKDHLSNLSS